MARSFDQPTGPNYAITSVGSVASLGNGAHTVIALFQTTSAASGNAGLISFRAAGINVQLIVDGGQLFGAGDFNGGQTGITTGTWWWAAIRKAAGTNVYRFSLRQYNTGSTTHQSTAATHADTGATNTTIRLGDGDNRGNGLIAAWAAWTSNLSDGQVAGMFTTAAADIAAQSPQVLWLGNQASSTDPIPDSTGNGAGSTSFNGTVGVGTDPPAYDYSLSAAQASARQPIIASGPRPLSIARQVLLRNTAALIVPPAKGIAPIVAARPVPGPASAALLRRSTLVDPPVLTTVRPIVVTAAAVTAAAASILLHAPAPAVAPASPQPVVVTAPAPAPPAQHLVLRSTLADPPVLTTTSPSVTTRPAPAPSSTALLLRGSLVDAVLPSTATPSPIVVTSTPPAGPAAAILIRTAPAAQPGRQPAVVTALAVAVPAAAVLLRGSIADAQVVTTASPTVVTATAVGPVGAALLFRTPQPAAAVAAVATPGPIVVTSTAPALPPSALMLRGSLADAPVFKTPPPLVVTSPTAQSATGAILVRSSLVDVAYARTALLMVTRPAPATRSAVLLLAAAQLPPAPTEPSAPTPTLVTRSGGLDLTTGRPIRNLVTKSTSRNLVTQTTNRDLEV